MKSSDRVGAPQPKVCAAVGSAPTARAAGMGSGNRTLTTSAVATAMTAPIRLAFTSPLAAEPSPDRVFHSGQAASAA